MIRRAKKSNPDGTVVVLGCYAQISPDEVSAIEGVDVVIGTDSRSNVIHYIEQYRAGNTDKPYVVVEDIMKITNFEARPSGQGNGTTAYDAGSMRNKQECFIQISDDDMFRCCRRVTRFVEVWEIATGVSLVSNGLVQREQAREDYRRQKNENRC